MKSRSHQQGIALVITLIMLSITLIMAVAFLAISTRERGSVTTGTDSNHARLAADTALAHAEAQVIASILSRTNAFDFGLLVSTNYINSRGFLAGVGNPTNVSYIYSNGTLLSSSDLQQNIANLQILPRAPVYVPNGSGNGYDFRYYLDLNRNRQFDETGDLHPTYFDFNNPSPYQTNFNVTIPEIGDPQWIGVLEHPDSPHGPLNPFIARYAFFAVPVGNTLDVNAIYNDTRRSDDQMRSGSDGFLRNEGVGSWEINLAAFLADLNTNEWDTPAASYNYQTPFGGIRNSGSAFDDALSLLRYRYDGLTGNQLSIRQYANFNVLQNNNIDDFSDGPLMTNNVLSFENDTASTINTPPWAGSDNTNHFFTPSDFFDKTKTQSAVAVGFPGFTDRLIQAGTNSFGTAPNQVPTYDRYTFYRMLAQLGTDSTPDYGKMNINYRNIDNFGNVVPGMETNFIPWTNALAFFTNAADRMLRAYTTNWFKADPTNFLATYYGNPGSYFYVDNSGNTVTNDPSGIGLTNRPLLGMTNEVPGFGLTGIPVYLYGNTFVYSPAIQRILQLAANIYDATTNAPYPLEGFYPSVFRPTFFRNTLSGDVFINGYTNVTDITGIGSDLRLSQPVDVSLLASTNFAALNNINVYGVPWIIGAKKGFPNFNEFNMLSTVQVTRKLQVNRPTATSSSDTYTTNQQYIMSITNNVGLSFWNSYDSTYVGSGNIKVYMSDVMKMVLTNGGYNNSQFANFSGTIPLSSWPGSAWTTATPDAPAPVPSSYVITNWSFDFLPESVYRSLTADFIPTASIPAPGWETNVVNNYVFPQFGLMSTNWVQAFILDGTHIIDYVQFSGPNRTRDINAELRDPNYADNSGTHYQWSTNAYGNNNLSPVPTDGEVNQIWVSKGVLTPPIGGRWSTTPVPPGFNTLAAQEAFFAGFWAPKWQYAGINRTNTELHVQAPYTPTRTMYDYTLWEANDPLVHYLATDLNYSDPGRTGLQKTDLYPPTLNIADVNLNQIGERYQPWGRVGQMAALSGVDTNVYNLAYRDPLITGSDFWDFPTNKFPTVGWLGRVHRGTPWQTIYLKATDILPQTEADGEAVVNNGIKTWLNWSGDIGNVFDATNSAPVNDRLLFDIFTTGPNQNASLGQLSVNQTHFAAWSALFSGLVMYTNLANTNLTIIQPGGVSNTNTFLGTIWNSIQQTRANAAMFPRQSFTRVGDILATPALTDQSPFLPWTDAEQKATGISDEMYEWLPQQTLSLLKLGSPRYVIYCYGQALKPAQNGKITSGNLALMCTNYTVVSETAVRAVVEVQDPTSKAPHIVLKNLNPLPPD